jgi:subtilisin family serine protease
MPVSLALPDPALRARELARRPVVAVPDTAVAKHPWFKDERTIVRLKYENGRLVPGGPPEDVAAATATGAEGLSDTPKPQEPVGLLHGHATFIAGLVRQGCPEATILSIPVMGEDGQVDEADILDVLEALLDRHVHGQTSHHPEDCIDVLSLSLGYYAEDRTYTSGPVADLLDRFAEAGVAVVAGAGNDGTSAPFVPAALAASLPQRITARALPPLSSVGASNPDGSTVALFSNPLPVITAVRPGVSVVSTLPLTNGMGQPSTKVDGDGPVRCTVDPDDYTGGFGVWSGTSFATPVFAAELAAAIAADKDLDDVSPSVMRRRALRALRRCTSKGGAS